MGLLRDNFYCFIYIILYYIVLYIIIYYYIIIIIKTLKKHLMDMYPLTHRW
jgi:hypothetical protein